MSTRLSNAVQAAVFATLVAAVLTSLTLAGRSSGPNGIVPSAADATIATLIVSGPIWYFAFPMASDHLDRAKRVGAVIVFFAVCGMFILNLTGNILANEGFASATLSDILLVPSLAIVFAVLTCFFLGIILLPLGAYAAYYLRRYQVNGAGTQQRHTIPQRRAQ